MTVSKDSGLPAVSALLATDILALVRGSTNNSITVANIQKMFANVPNGMMFNGRILPSVSAGNLTLALKTFAGADPSATDPVSVFIGGAIRIITSALSVTKNAATNWCNAGSAELATREIDYFAYLGYNATDRVVIGFSRIPYARIYSDFNPTTTNEKYAAISTITNAAAGDEYCVIGRFAATLSAGAGYTWSVPAYTPVNLIQSPIYETRLLNWTPQFVGFSAIPATFYAGYMFKGSLMKIMTNCNSDGTSNGTSLTFTLPFTMAALQYSKLIQVFTAFDNSSQIGAMRELPSASNIISLYASITGAGWTASGNKGYRGINLDIPI